MARRLRTCKQCRLRLQKTGDISTTSDESLPDETCRHEPPPTKVPRTNARALLERVNRISTHEQVSNRPLIFAQMFDKFVESHQHLWLAHTGDFLRTLQSTHITSPSLRHTLAAVTYGDFSRMSADKQYLYEGRKHYGRALAALSKTTKLSDDRSAQETPASVLMSIVLIGLYQQREQVCGVQNVSWTVHYFGAQQYIKACGPQGFDVYNESERTILLAQWLVCISFHLNLRKRMALGIRDYEAFGLPAALAGTILGEWMPQGIRAPELLEELDVAVSDPPSDSRAEKALAIALEADCMVATLRAWRSKWIKTTEPPELDLEVEEHIFLSASSRFTDQLWYSGDASYNLFAIITDMISVMMDCAILRLLKEIPAISPRFQRLSSSDVLKRSNDAAIRLCRSVQYASHQPSIVWQCTVTEMLELLCTLFQARGAMDEHGWCETCRIALEVRARRLATIEPQLLAPPRRRLEYVGKQDPVLQRLQDVASSGPDE